MIPCPLCRGQISSFAPNLDLRSQIEAAEQLREQQLPSTTNAKSKSVEPAPQPPLQVPSPAAVGPSASQQRADPAAAVPNEIQADADRVAIPHTHYSQQFPKDLCSCCDPLGITSKGLAAAWEEEEAACDDGCCAACVPALKLRCKHLSSALLCAPAFCGTSLAALVGGVCGIFCGGLLPFCVPSSAGRKGAAMCCAGGVLGCYFSGIYLVDSLWQCVRLPCNLFCTEAISPIQYQWDLKIAKRKSPWGESF